MTEKRYFKREWEGEYYIFDSQVISEKEFDEKVKYEDYQAFADSMIGDEVINRLNESEELKHQINYLEDRLDELIVLKKENNDLEKEVLSKLQNKNKELKNENQYIKNTIKDMIDNERTEIGKSVLKQLWEVIQ